MTGNGCGFQSDNTVKMASTPSFSTWASRALAVDLLNRSLLSDFLPLQGARGFGLFLMKRLGPLRRVIMSEGVAPAASMPRLMRGEALS